MPPLPLFAIHTHHLSGKREPPLAARELAREIDDEHVPRVGERGLPAAITPTRTAVRCGHIQLVVVDP